MNLTKKNPIIVDLDKLFKQSMNDLNIALTRGYNMAFGVYSKELLKYFYPGIVDVLLANCVPKGTEGDDAESRRQSVKSVVKVVETLGIDEVSKEQRMQILETLYKALDDYAVDRRGDVGSWVRQESMYSLKTYIDLVVSSS